MTRTAERRGQILQAARKLFSHYGTHKTTISDIAREVGIGVGSVYLEFCSKEEIIAELARERRKRVAAAMEADRNGTHAEQLTGALEARVRALFAVAAEGAHSCDLVACRATPNLARPFSDEELAVLERIVDAGKQAGEFAPRDTTSVVQAVAEAFSALSPPRLFERQPGECVAACRALSELLMLGISARKKSGR